MSAKEIEKNFSLSAAFEQYVINHPEILNGVPENAQIVMGDEKDHQLTRKNMLFLRKARGGVYQALRHIKNGWVVRQVR